ncbi:hypothetical protein AB0I35_12885 [Nocardia sp. NPDC050378]|uniref:hypothetical protein n=1 Tax=Nocardia sp. NPDC050378 TaxID=3155400 RepID=UPI0033C2DCB2
MRSNNRLGEDVAMEGSPIAGIMSIEVSHQVIRSFDRDLRTMNIPIQAIHRAGKQAGNFALRLYANPPYDPHREAAEDRYKAFHRRLNEHIESMHTVGIEANSFQPLLDWIIYLKGRLTEEIGQDVLDAPFNGPFLPFDIRRFSIEAAIALDESINYAKNQARSRVGVLLDIARKSQASKKTTCPLCELCVTFAKLSDQLLAIQPPAYFGEPRYYPPERHGGIVPGFLARLIAQDIDDLIVELTVTISSSDELRNLGALTREKKAKILTTLDRLTPVTISANYLQSIEPFSFSETALLDSTDMAAAFLSISVHYLKDVQSKMADYSEASGQSSNYSVQINGGNFYGSQVALQISNIDSSISTVVNQGNSQLADALEAVKQAAMTDPAIPNDRRTDLIDNVEYLAESASEAPEARNRGIVRSVLASLNSAASTAPQLAQALETWGGILNSIIP